MHSLNIFELLPLTHYLQHEDYVGQLESFAALFVKKFPFLLFLFKFVTEQYPFRPSLYYEAPLNELHVLYSRQH